jgi:uncharacterized protein YjbI with pentapeptide repeats
MTQAPNQKRVSRLDLHGAYLRGTDFSRFDLENANLSGADFTAASFRGANFKNANLNGTILRGADLTDATNLTREQLAKAIIDDQTRLPTLANDPAPAK